MKILPSARSHETKTCARAFCRDFARLHLVRGCKLENPHQKFSGDKLVSYDADDLLLISETAPGLQNCIDKMQNFYNELELKINIKKTKIIIFNKRGITFKNKFNFYLDGSKLEITDHYQYLGLKLRPSGSFKMGVQELQDKASRAWFGINNTI